MKNWEIKALNDSKAEIYLYSDIGYDWKTDKSTAELFVETLKDLGDISYLDVHINSNGGDVFAGQTIYSLLKRHKAYVTVYVDGLAASIASVIAMAGDKVIIPENAMLMIHNAWTGMYGNSEELRKMADDLDHINNSIVFTYVDKAKGKCDESVIRDLMNKETWLSAKEAFELGLCDEVANPVKIAAKYERSDFRNFKNVPKEIFEKENYDFKTERAQAMLKLLEV